ncbi:MAG: hypothetical protein L0Z55_04305 [Planctomycetes bacterium]|nr:hypothetical protein [Planctomycetota bacterium]
MEVAKVGEQARGIWERIKRFILRWSRVGRLQLDRMDTKSALNGAYRDLGRAAAERLVDRDESSLDRAERGIADQLARIRDLRKQLAELEEAVARAKKE